MALASPSAPTALTGRSIARAWTIVPSVMTATSTVTSTAARRLMSLIVKAFIAGIIDAFRQTVASEQQQTTLQA
jgi:hypothetical protein